MCGRSSSPAPAHRVRRARSRTRAEALLREWPACADGSDDDAERRRLHRHIAQAAEEWAAAGRAATNCIGRRARRGARLGGPAPGRAERPRTRVRDEQPRRRRAAGEACATKEQTATGTARRRVDAAGCIRGPPGPWLSSSAATPTRPPTWLEPPSQRSPPNVSARRRWSSRTPISHSYSPARQCRSTTRRIPRGCLLTALARAPSAIGIMHGDDEALLQSVSMSPDRTTLAVLDFYKRLSRVSYT